VVDFNLNVGNLDGVGGSRHGGRGRKEESKKKKESNKWAAIDGSKKK
jgi:hypothetical protein